MKKYFTKWLPVEGVVVVNDKVFSRSNETVLPVALTEAMAELANKIGHKKARLFLCSRDIQVGDEVRIIGETWIGNYQRGMDSEYCYKVIGEISSQAIWVKEGDELTEDHIQILPERDLTDWLWKHPNNYIPHERMDSIQERYNIYAQSLRTPKIVKILGKCGHFH